LQAKALCYNSNELTETKMALAAKRKPRVQHRKRVAQHHKQTSHYLKTYWPYLPAVGIVALGVLVNQWLYKSDSLAQAGANLSGLPKPTRIEAITGNTDGLALGLIIAMSGIALGILLFQHWFRVQRTLNRGEMFVAKHPWIDLVLVVVVMAGVILTRQVI
jgi:uncharacterized membrane protein YidH (DUF202 family)